jgi:hypothetical protein
MPYLIVTNGLTGSGKSGLIDKVIAHCGLNKGYNKYFIDDLVEGNAHYKASVDSLVKNMCGQKMELCGALRDKLLDPDEEIIKEFNKVYWETRRGRYCAGAGSCEDALDGLVDSAIKNKENMVFETTGSYYVEWLLAKLPKEETYSVYYAFTLVEFCDNLNRNKLRAVKSMREYVQDRAKPAPRLPDITKSKFRADMQALFGNLTSLLMQTLIGKLKHGERLLVFSNAAKKKKGGVENAELMFDSVVGGSVAPVIKKIEDLLHVEARC